MILEHASLVQNCNISDVASDVNLVQADHSSVKTGNSVAIVYQFLGIQVDGTVVNTELIKPEKGNGGIVEVEENDLGQALGTVDLLFLLLYSLI